MNKYLITGVCGFVGRYFVDYLRHHESDAEIIGLDIAAQTSIKNIIYRQLNLMDKSAVQQILAEQKPNKIVHLAAVSSVAQSWKDPEGCFMNNVSSFLNLVDGVRDLGLPCRILSVGSSEEYGYYDEPVRENFALHPKNPYSVARVSQEYLSKLYIDYYEEDIVMTRSFSHIGPGQSTLFAVPSFIEQLVAISRGERDNKMLVGNINVVRDFLDVRDVVEAYYQIIAGGKTREVYNVCSGAGVCLRDIIGMAAKQLNITPNIEIDPAHVRKNDMKMMVGDNSKIKSELNWVPRYSLECTIRDIIRAMRG